jgi:hypothetical protein
MADTKAAPVKGKEAEKIDLLHGHKKTLFLKGTGTSIPGINVAWASSAPEVVSVAPSGMRAEITALKAGSAKVSATVTCPGDDKPVVCETDVTVPAPVGPEFHIEHGTSVPVA